MSIENIIKESLEDLINAIIIDGTCNHLIFPQYRDKSTRHSEQELKQIFLKRVEDSNTYYSVETPTRLVYRFTDGAQEVKSPDSNPDNTYKSARFDVSLYSENNKDALLSHIEFKYGNPDQKNAICKDFLKLVSEVKFTNEKKNFFVHYLSVKEESGWKSRTFPSLFKKYCKSVKDIKKSFENEDNQEFFGKLSENLSNVTVYLLCFFETSKSGLTYSFSLNDLKNYIDKKMDDKNSSEKDWLWLNEKIFNTENSI